ncbi:hypothetical protein [Cupriavidus necator]
MREIAPQMVQAASRSRCRKRHDCSPDAHDQDGDDPSQVALRLDQIDDPIGHVTADGAYDDGAPTYQTIAQYGDGTEAVIPPRSTAVPSGELGPLTQRDHHLKMDHGTGPASLAGGRRLWATRAGRNGDGPLQVADRPKAAGARSFPAQQTEAAIGVVVLNRMLVAGRPKSIRCKRAAA